MSINTLFTSTMLDVVQFQTKNISCIECRKAFIFSIEEQEFFHGLGLTNTPKRCPHCRILIRMRREGKLTNTVTQLNCVECGEKTTVPFLPKNERAIYCPACFRQFKRGNLQPQ